MLSKTLLIIGLTTLFTACAGPDVNYGDNGQAFFAPNISHLPVNIEQIDKDIYEKVSAAAMIWRTPFHSENKTMFTSIKSLPAHLKIEINPNYQELEEGGTGFRLSGVDSCTIYLANKDVDFLDISHQLGHCLGFRHDTWPNSLMYPLPFKKDEIYITSEMKYYLDQIKYITPTVDSGEIR